MYICIIQRLETKTHARKKSTTNKKKNEQYFHRQILKWANINDILMYTSK